MEYTTSRTVDTKFDETIDKVTAALSSNGFGIITHVDLAEKFKEKLGIDYPKYTILGACNPAMAHKALGVEDKIGVMLPCNVVVREKDNGMVEVSAINPLHSIGSIGNKDLEPIAREIGEKLKNVIDSI